MRRGNIWRGHQGAVREWHAQHRRLCGADKLLVLAGSLITGLAVRTDVIGGKEGTDNELAGFDRGDRAADLLDDAAVLVTHRGRLGERADAAIGPQVGPANAGGRDPDDGIRRLDDRRRVALLETHI